MKLKKWYQHYLKTFYGVTGPFDEYKQAIIGKIAMMFFPPFFLGNGLIAAVSLIFGYRYPETTAWGTPLSIFLYSFILYSILHHQLRKAGVYDFDLEELSTEQVTKVRHSPFKFVLIWSIFMFIWSLFSQTVLDEVTLMTALTNPRTYVGLLIGAGFILIVYIVLIYYGLKQKENQSHE